MQINVEDNRKKEVHAKRAFRAEFPKEKLLSKKFFS